MYKKPTKEQLDTMRKLVLADVIKDDLTPDLMKFFENTRFEDFEGLSKLYRNSSREKMNYLLKDMNLSNADIDRFYNFVNSPKYNDMFNALKTLKNSDKNLQEKINLVKDYAGIYSNEMLSYMLDVGSIKYGNDPSDYNFILKSLNSKKNVVMKRFKFFEFITYCEETIKEIFGWFFNELDFYNDILIINDYITVKVDFKITLNISVETNDTLKKALFHHSLSLLYFQNICDEMNDFIKKTNRGDDILSAVRTEFNENNRMIIDVTKYTTNRIQYIKDTKNIEVCCEGNVGILFHIYGFIVFLEKRINELVETYEEYVSSKKKAKNNKRREVYKVKERQKRSLTSEGDKVKERQKRSLTSEGDKSKKRCGKNDVGGVEINPIEKNENVMISEGYISPDDSQSEGLSPRSCLTTDELTEIDSYENSDDDETEHSCVERDDDKPEFVNNIVIHDKNINHLIFNRYVFINCVCKIRYNEKRLLRTCLNMYFDTNKKYQDFIRINQVERIDIVKGLHTGFTDGEHFNVMFISLVNPKLKLTVFHVYLDCDPDENMFLTTMTVIYNPFD